MNTELTQILSEVRALADEQGWTSVRHLADCAGAATGAVGVVMPDDVEPAPFLRWLGQVAPAAAGPQATFGQLLEAPGPALSSDKLLGVFQCGHLLDTTATDTLADLFFDRPRASYAFVFTGAERIETPQDLDIVLRGAWRLLVPGEKPDWADQNLQDQNIFLWSQSGSRLADMAPRLQRDSTALIGWLRTPLPEPAAQVLAHQRVLWVMEAAQQANAAPGLAKRATPSAPPNELAQARRLAATGEALQSLRRRLQNWIDDTTSASERALLATLQTLEQDLEAGLAAFLRNAPALQTDQRLGGAAFAQVVNSYIGSKAQTWSADVDRLWADRVMAVQHDLKGLLTATDWAPLNEAAGAQGVQVYYPDSLLAALRTGQRSSLGVSLATEAQDPVAPAGARRRDTLSALVVMALVGGASAGAATLLGANPVLVVAASEAGAIAAGAVDRRMKVDRHQQVYEQTGQELVRRAVRRARAQIIATGRADAEAQRARMGTAWAALDALLVQAQTTNRRTAAPAMTRRDDSVTARLQDLHRRALALTETS